ncbi:MAG: mycothiol synthase [Frankiaceae bacterium]|nr:mycothiol synthase [Frankiaceae bacterium]
MTAETGTTAYRLLTADDVDALVELNSLCDIAESGQPDHEVITWIRDGADDYTAYGIFDDHGLAAAAWIDTEPSGHIGFEGDVRVRPGLDKSLGDPLLDAIRATAASADPQRPLHYFANASADRARAWAESRGATLIRHFWRMRIDLDADAVTVPAPPAGVTVRLVRDDESDLREVYRVVDTAFADHFGHDGSRSYEQWMTSVRKRSHLDLSLWWFAEVDGVPVAALLGWRLPDHEAEWTGQVGTLGTLREARGRGIGSLLLRTAFAEFAARGLRKATLGVDAANPTGAVRLYESVGMRAEHDWVLYEFPPL